MNSATDVNISRDVCVCGGGGRSDIKICAVKQIKSTILQLFFLHSVLSFFSYPVF